MDDVVGVVVRALHILSVIALVGAAFAVFFGGWEARRLSAVSVVTPIVLLIATGLFSLLTKGDLPKGYHMIFGIKMLLALHIFAVALLALRPAIDDKKRARWMAGIVASGSIIVLLSAHLRSITR